MEKKDFCVLIATRFIFFISDLHWVAFILGVLRNGMIAQVGATSQGLWPWLLPRRYRHRHRPDLAPLLWRALGSEQMAVRYFIDIVAVHRGWDRMGWNALKGELVVAVETNLVVKEDVNQHKLKFSREKKWKVILLVEDVCQSLVLGQNLIFGVTKGLTLIEMTFDGQSWKKRKKIKFVFQLTSIIVKKSLNWTFKTKFEDDRLKKNQINRSVPDHNAIKACSMHGLRSVS